MAVTIPPPEGLTEEQRRAWFQHSYRNRDDIRAAIRRDLPYDRQYPPRRYNRTQLLSWLVGIPVPPEAKKPAQLAVPLAPVTPAPRFEMPGEGASREELITALTRQLEIHVQTLASVRAWVIRLRKRKGSVDIYANGRNQFLRHFGLPEHWTRAERGYGRTTDEPQQIPVPQFPLFDPDHLRDEGLRWQLEHRQEMFDKIYAGMRQYAIDHKSYFAPEHLTEGLALIHQPPYVVPQFANLRVTVSWRLPDTAQLSSEQSAAWTAEAESLMCEAATIAAPENSTLHNGRIDVTAQVRFDA